MALELVSFSDLSDLLDLEQALITNYPALNVLRTSVTFAIESFIGRNLESKERTETVFIYTPARKMIKLKALPITEIDSVVFGDFDGTETAYTTSDYRVTGYGIELLSEVSNGYITATYTGGYTAGNVPEEITRAALLQTAYEFQGKNYIGSESVSTEGGTVTRPAIGLLDEVKRMLQSHKHPLRAH